MGNTNKRATPRSSQTGAQWDEASVIRLISENKLAPKYGDNASKSGKSSFECPICFLEFGILNTVSCCKQHICTDCLVQVKGTDTKGACPFCGNADLNASLIPLEKKSASAPSSSKTVPPTKTKDDRTSSTSEGDRSSGASTAALSYTTPEQEKKLRSYSLDDTTPANGTHSATASKTDREALERQIREQRLQFDERDLAEATARSARTNPRANSAGSSYLRYTSRTRYGAAPGGTDGSPGFGTASPLGSYFRTGAISSRSADSAANEAAGTGRTSPPNGSLRFVSSLEGLLQNHGNTRITSIEQLEDIMLMEAIRLSMQDAGVSADSDAAPAQALPAPPARSSSSSSRTASRTASPVPPNPPNSSTSTSHQTSRHSPARSAGTPVGQRGVAGGEAEEDGSSSSSSEYEEEVEGEAEEEEGDEGLLYGAEGDEEVTEEEEQQILLAMQLSLAEANHNTTNNTPTSRSEQHAITDTTSSIDTALIPTDSHSERDSPHFVDSAGSGQTHAPSDETHAAAEDGGGTTTKFRSSEDSGDQH